MKFRVRHIIIGTCAWGILSLMGCADDPGDGMEQMHTHELCLSLGTHQFDATRVSGDLPPDFILYNHATAIAKIMQIQGYMAYWNTDKKPEPGWDALPCTFDHTTSATSADIWTSRVPLKVLDSGDEIPDDRETYYFYGFMPKGDVTDVLITPYGSPASYANGAIMTFNGMDSVTPDDISVIVGVQGYDGTPANIPDMTNGLGKFSYYPERDGRYIFLLIDHFYAGLCFRFRVHEEYAKLRAIKLKKLKLVAYRNEACTQLMTKKVSTTVTLSANSSGASPIVDEIEFDPVLDSGDMDPVLIYDNETNPVLLPSGENYTENMGFVPKTSSYYKLISTYDVYDTDASGNPRNLIRKDCTAENKIDPRNLYNQESLDRGKKYTVKVTVRPTYLYVLSEPDLDNPTMVIN